jgi:hypothetical protein
MVQGLVTVSITSKVKGELNFALERGRIEQQAGGQNKWSLRIVNANTTLVPLGRSTYDTTNAGSYGLKVCG